MEIKPYNDAELEAVFEIVQIPLSDAIVQQFCDVLGLDMDSVNAVLIEAESVLDGKRVGNVMTVKRIKSKAIAEK